MWGGGKCGRCNKTVYAAEQKLAEGNVWHQVCWNLEFKERELRKKAHKDQVSYNKIADANASEEVRELLQNNPAPASPVTVVDFDPTFSQFATKPAGPVTRAKPTSPGAEDICPRCNKKVYHAEHRIAEGLTWHQQCWAKEFKERELAKKSRKDNVSYNPPADVQPAYYRVADIDAGIPARLESASPEAVQAAPQATPQCPSCSRARTPGDRFCAGCGTRLE